SSEPAAGWAPGIGLLLCWQAALTLLRPARRLAREPATSRWPAMILALLVPLAALALLSLHPPLRGPLAYRTVLAQVPWRLLLELDDMDGDGYPGLLGGDCAPWDETRHPAAEDLPGNGLDEDCLGGDAALRPRQQVVASSLTGRFLGRNLVLVTIGNLGAAQLSGNGSPRLITPAIDLLVSRGILLSRAWAQSTSCSASLASLLKGRYPRQLALSPAAVAPDATVHPLRQGEQAPPGTRVVWNAPLHDTSTSLAGHLADHDRLTLAVAAAVEQAPGTGLLHGFAQVDATPLSEAGTEAGKPVVDDRAVQAALGLLDEVRGRTFFLWVHLPDAEPPHLLHGGTPYHGDAPASRYDGEVAFADAQLGRLLGRMDQQGLLASTLVVVTADHGPALAAQPPGLLADQLHVPLLFLLPGEEARSIPAFVENVDVLPTVLELLGLPAPPGLAGQSLVPLFDGVRTERLRPEVVAELRTAGRSLRTLLSGDRQLLLDERLGLATLLPVRHGQGGPSEPEPEVALLEQLLQRLAQWDRRGPPPPTEPVQ
ncbi:MAG: sulfatase, partial [Deltaproteobacteria bacterium]|nr:sulfatase [Deltaproteobacteria bacterium]